MKDVIFKPKTVGYRLNNVREELLHALDNVFLSVVKLELDTGKAWLLQSKDIDSEADYEFDWDEYISFYQSVLEPYETEKFLSFMNVAHLANRWQEGLIQYRVNLKCAKKVTLEWLEFVICFGCLDDRPTVYVITRQGSGSYIMRAAFPNKIDAFKISSVPKKNNYEEIVQRFVDAYVVPEEREMVLENLDIERVVEVLSEKEEHVFTCGFIEKDGRYARKKFEYRYYDREKGTIVMSCSDVTLIYEEQQRYIAELQASIAREQSDPITRLLNYRGIKKEVNSSLNAFKGVSALLFIDMDNFKAVNDTYGHLVGDDVLRTVAKTLKDSIRASDFAARVGGDEFVVFLVDVTSQEQALKCAERICQNLNRLRLQHDEYCLSCSIGVALAPKDGTSYRELVKKADKMVYKAKAGGKNQVAME